MEWEVSGSRSFGLVTVSPATASVLMSLRKERREMTRSRGYLERNNEWLDGFFEVLMR